MKFFLIPICVSLFLASCLTAEKPKEIEITPENDLDYITLPAGFEIDLFCEGLEGARSLSLGPNGIVFVGSMEAGNVYAAQDLDGDMKADKVYTLGSGMNWPNGVAYREGDLYIAEIDQISVMEDVVNQLDNPKVPTIVYDGYPDKKHHGWKYIDFGPDGNLYVPVGGPCNVCDEEDEVFASITRLNPETWERTVYAHGVRNSVGFDWHPKTGELWFTDNGRDNLGDDIPADELNYAPEPDMHFGFPFCHQGEILDPTFGEGKDCSAYTAPAQKLGPHVAALGMKFYTGEMFPEQYKNVIFIPERGSWNRSEPIGYRVTMVRLEGNKSVSYEIFADGWLQNGETKGRPVDLLQMPDGSFLLSDDLNGVIYRIHYTG